jgi:hypothetical protein
VNVTLRLAYTACRPAVERTLGDLGCEYLDLYLMVGGWVPGVLLANQLYLFWRRKMYSPPQLVSPA